MHSSNRQRQTLRADNLLVGPWRELSKCENMKILDVKKWGEMTRPRNQKSQKLNLSFHLTPPNCNVAQTAES